MSALVVYERGAGNAMTGARRLGLNTGIFEADVIKAIDEALSLFGIFHFRNNTGAIKTTRGAFVRFGFPGSADFLGICPGGKFLSVEVKRPGGRLSPAQSAWLDAVNREGGVAIWVDSVDSLTQQLRERGVIT